MGIAIHAPFCAGILEFISHLMLFPPFCKHRCNFAKPFNKVLFGTIVLSSVDIFYQFLEIPLDLNQKDEPCKQTCLFLAILLKVCLTSLLGHGNATKPQSIFSGFNPEILSSPPFEVVGASDPNTPLSFQQASPQKNCWKTFGVGRPPATPPWIRLAVRGPGAP